METTLTDQNKAQLHTFTSMGAAGAAGHGWGLKTAPERKRRGRRRRRRRAGRKPRQGRGAVAWLGAASRRCSREMTGPCNGDTMAIADPVQVPRSRLLHRPLLPQHGATEN